MRLASKAEIPDGEGRPFLVGEMEIAVFNCRGAYFAVGDVCTHAHALLHEGSVDRFRQSVECPLHGAEYDLRTGEVLTPPATEPVPVFAVRENGDAIEIALPPDGGTDGQVQEP